jgi:predicted N-formylglutamate amidohydrolase
MNRLIAKLAVESNLNSDNVPYHLTDYMLYDYPEVENFAKAIIEICRDVADKNIDRNENQLPSDRINDYFDL